MPGTPYSQRSRPPPGPGRPDPGRAGRPAKETALTTQDNSLTIRPITGRTKFDLFNRLPYRLTEELAADLDQGHRRPGWLWLAPRDGRLAARRPPEDRMPPRRRPARGCSPNG